MDFCTVTITKKITLFVCDKVPFLKPSHIYDHNLLQYPTIFASQQDSPHEQLLHFHFLSCPYIFGVNSGLNIQSAVVKSI